MPSVTVSTIPKGDDIDIYRGDTLSVDVQRLGNIAARTNLWFTVKDDKDDTDVNSQIQIDENNGLLYIVGAVALIPANGSITVTDAVTGALTVALDEVETAKLTDLGTWFYDIQIVTATAVTTLVRGKATIVADATRATS